MSQQNQFSNLLAQLRDVGGAHRRELIGGAAALAGGLLLLAVLRPDPGGETPFLTVLAGWTAPLLALAILIVGVVLLLGHRAGYWSAEALVGAELLLLGLPIWTYVMANEAVNWAVRLDGSAGGLIGWALGNLLMSAFGRPLALAAAALLVVGGGALLLRYTPLVFGVVSVAGWLPSLGEWGNGCGAKREAPTRCHIQPALWPRIARRLRRGQPCSASRRHSSRLSRPRPRPLRPKAAAGQRPNQRRPPAGAPLHGRRRRRAPPLARRPRRTPIPRLSHQLPRRRLQHLPLR